eukprot:gene13767-29278_t
MIADTYNTKKVHKDFQLRSNESYRAEALKRIEHGRNFAKSMPFDVQEWWSVYYGPCPRKYRPVTPNDKWLFLGNDRGILMAHKQIWDNFIFEERFIANTSDKDILIVFEDDAISAVTNVTWSLENELNDMHTDMLYLGWCHGDKKGKIPMCGHAYAMTREGIKKALKETDICGHAVDGQLVNFISRGILTYRKAKPESFASLLPGYIASGGIFRQMKHLVSFNYHWWVKPDSPSKH